MNKKPPHLNLIKCLISLRKKMTNTRALDAFCAKDSFSNQVLAETCVINPGGVPRPT